MPKNHFSYTWQSVHTRGFTCGSIRVKIYHTEIDYKEEAKKYRVGENYLMNGGNLVGNADNN